MTWYGKNSEGGARHPSNACLRQCLPLRAMLVLTFEVMQHACRCEALHHGWAVSVDQGSACCGLSMFANYAVTLQDTRGPPVRTSCTV